ncbi:MAG: TetR family transcriptional regulator [Microbacterium chocolatum]|nr:TetR family transcriptional regulator [Microbacterium chocolatum]
MRTNQGFAGDDRGTFGGRMRRAQIERAAAEVLSEVGYAAASVSRIADRAGVEIFRRLAVQLLDGCAAHITDRVPDEMPPALRLRARIHAELEYFASRRIEFLAMAEVMANHRDEDFGRAFEGIAESDIDTVAGILREGQEAGEFRPLDAHEAAHLIDAAKNGVLDRWAADESLDLEPMSASLLDFVARAVRADGA